MNKPVSRASPSIGPDGELEFFDRVEGRWISVKDALMVVIDPQDE